MLGIRDARLNRRRLAALVGACVVVTSPLAGCGGSDDASPTTSTLPTSVAPDEIPDGSFEAEPKVPEPSDANVSDGVECDASGTFSGAVTAEFSDAYAPTFKGDAGELVWSVDLPEINFNVARNGDEVRAQGGTSNSAWFGSGETVTVDGEWGKGSTATVKGSMTDATGANPIDFDITFSC